MVQLKLIASKDSLFCTRVECALKLKGIEYKYLEEDLNNKSPTLLKYNPIHKKVPVLLADRKPIIESLVILEYLDEVWKDNPLLPQDPYERATARFWAKFVDDKVVMESYEACKKAPGEKKDKLIESTKELVAFLEKELAGKKFFGGDHRIGYLHLVMGWVPLELRVMEEVGDMKLLDAEKFPCLHEWSKNYMDVPIIQQCIPSTEILFAYFRESVRQFRSLEANNP